MDDLEYCSRKCMNSLFPLYCIGACIEERERRRVLEERFDRNLALFVLFLMVLVSVLVYLGVG